MISCLYCRREICWFRGVELWLHRVTLQAECGWKAPIWTRATPSLHDVVNLIKQERRPKIMLDLKKQITARIKELDSSIVQAIREKKILDQAVREMNRNSGKSTSRKSHGLSPATRRKIAATQRARWKKLRHEAKAKTAE